MSVKEFKYPFQTLAENTFIANFNFLNQEYTVLLFLEDSDWTKPVVFGCDQFSQLIHRCDEKKDHLIQYLMQITDPATGFFIINRFIQCYGASKPPSEPPSKVEVNLLEEIRGIGFDKVIEVDDSFSRIVLKVDIELFCTVRIFPTTVEYSFDFYSSSVPNVITPDLKKGFLARILKIAQTRYKHLNRVREIFSEIDNKFPTIRPDRHTVSSFIRNIHMGEEVEPVRIVYDPLTDLFSVLNCDFKIEEIEVAYERIVDFIASINRVECRECGICYSDFLDGQVANFNCPNVDGCQHVYHESCLREWFLSNPESKSVFNRISGNCLFCEKEIHLQINNSV